MTSYTLPQPIRPGLDCLEDAAKVVYQSMQPTSQHHWPLLSKRLGTEVWVKHENHTPIGSFKLRGGLIYMPRLKAEQPTVRAIITATRGNHGQSIAFNAKQAGLGCTIIVPKENSPCKNRAMEGYGATLIVHGDNLAESTAYAHRLAIEQDAHFIPSFHPWLAEGVASHALEFFRNAPELDTVYVAIGKGSAACATVWARNALGLKTKIVGVVAKGAPAYAMAFETKRPASTSSVNTFACGVACSDTGDQPLAILLDGLERVVQVSEDELFQGVALYYHDTHNLAEGAGAVSLAGLIQERHLYTEHHRVGVFLSGGNVDPEHLNHALATDLSALPA